MAIYDFFVSRNNSAANAAAYIGHVGRLFYDSTNGVVKLSDGTTPGGTPIPYTIATPTIVGGIKAGPGANVSLDGTLTIDTAGLPLGIGNIQINDTTISSVNADTNIVLESNGEGNVELVGNVHFHTTVGGTASDPYFTAKEDGQITVFVPASDPLSGAFKIVGSTTGKFSPPVNTGVMLQLTGNNNDASRLYNDAIGGFAAFVGRRVNGNLTVPTAVQAGDEIIRISSTGYDGTAIAGTGTGRFVFQAKENYTTSAKGTNVSIWSTAIGSNVLTKTATFDVESGVTLTKATVQGNLTVSGNIVGNATTTTATIGTANVTTLDVSGNATVSGYFTGKWLRSVRNAGTIGTGGTLTIDFSDAALVYCTWGDGMTINYSNFLPGRVVRVLATKATGTGTDSISLDGVTAAQTSTGATSVSAAADTTTFLEITCVGSSIGNVFIKI